MFRHDFSMLKMEKQKYYYNDVVVTLINKERICFRVAETLINFAAHAA